MNLNECYKILTYMSSAFPTFYGRADKEYAKKQAAVWTDILGEYDAKDVLTGVRAYISADASGFPPTPGQIVEHIHRVKHPSDLEGPQAWALVRKAVQHSGYDARAAYDALPKDIQRCVGSPDSLRAMAIMEIDKFETVAQSNFLRTYEAVKRREAIESKYPQKVRPQISEKPPAAKIEGEIPEPVRDTISAPENMVEKLRRRLDA